MLKLTKRMLLASFILAAPVMALSATAASAEGLISIIVNDPSNPYWFTEGEVAAAKAKEPEEIIPKEPELSPEEKRVKKEVSQSPCVFSGNAKLL